MIEAPPGFTLRTAVVAGGPPTAELADAAAAMADVVESLVGTYYRVSEGGWGREEKVRELLTPRMHHFQLICRETGDLAAFASALPTTESGGATERPVLYIYELHVLPGFQRQGLGSWLLEVLLAGHLVAAQDDFRDCARLMLTCHLANTNALRFYHRHRFATDESCPSNWVGPRRARQIGYTILSRPLGQ